MKIYHGGTYQAVRTVWLWAPTRTGKHTAHSDWRQAWLSRSLSDDAQSVCILAEAEIDQDVVTGVLGPAQLSEAHLNLAERLMEFMMKTDGSPLRKSVSTCRR